MNKITIIEYSKYQKNNKYEKYLVEYKNKVLFISQENKKEPSCVECEYKKECANNKYIISREEKINFLICDIQDLSKEITDKKEILRLSILYKKIKLEMVEITKVIAMIKEDFISQRGMAFEKGEIIEISTYADTYSIVKKENGNITHIENKYFNIIGDLSVK